MNTRRSLTSTIGFLVISLAALPAVAQSGVVIREVQLIDMISKAISKRENVSFRQTVKTTGYDPGVSSESVFDQGHNGWHSISVEKSPGREVRTEIITIGDKKYTRIGEGDWKIEAADSPARGSGLYSGSGSSGSTTIEKQYVFVGAETIRGRKTEHYRKVVTFIFAEARLKRVLSYDYWFDDRGLLMRQINKYGRLASSEEYVWSTDYDYEAKFKIEEPIK